MSAVRIRHGARLMIEDALRLAGVTADPAAVAGQLREAGAFVSRDSHARWFCDKQHPAVRRWLADLVAGCWQPPEPDPGPPAGRGTGRHVIP